jgi:hypothetical protein
MLGYDAPRRKTMDPLCNPAHAGLWASIGPDILKGLPAAFVALVIGMIAAAIAARQYLVARAKLNLDLFQRRYALYEGLRMFLSSHFTEMSGTKADMRFLNSVHEAYFLFGPEIGGYMERIADETGEYLSAQLALIETQHPEEKAMLETAVQGYKMHFSQELAELRTRFGKYMDFAEWH